MIALRLDWKASMNKLTVSWIMLGRFSSPSYPEEWAL